MYTRWLFAGRDNLASRRARLMTVATAGGHHVAKKKAGRPKAVARRGEGKLVRIDPDIVGKAKVITGRRNLDLGPFLSELLKGPIDREYQRVLSELAELEGRK